MSTVIARSARARTCSVRPRCTSRSSGWSSQPTSRSSRSAGTSSPPSTSSAEADSPGRTLRSRVSLPGSSASRCEHGGVKLRRTSTTERPGLVRTVRIDRRVDQLVARANPGEIAVIDVIDLDRGTAEQLVAAGVSAVVNASATSSGRFPVHGAQTLLEAGVVLVDDVGGEVFSRVRDGDTVRLDGADLYAAGDRAASGAVQSDETVAEIDAIAREGLRARVSTLVADAGRRLTSDSGHLLEGDGFPAMITDLGG